MKKRVSALIGILPSMKEGSSPESESDESEAGMDKEAGREAARMFVKAVRGGDPDAVLDAFKSVSEHCAGYGEADGESDEE